MCAGKDCRKLCEFAKMHDLLAARGDVLELKCVGICKGPVVVVNPTSKDAAVFAKVRSKKQRRSILQAAEGSPETPDALSSLRVSGKHRRSALKRVSRALD
ncbi:MAG: hypothetical protein AAFP84_21295 [Actinomycetota bacterium]